MTFLNLNSAPTGESPSPIAQLGKFALKGTAFIGGGSFVLAVVELLRSDPETWSSLLRAWGPQALLAGGFLYVLNNIAVASIRAREKSDALMSAAIDRMSTQQERLATAAETAAAKDDRQFEALQILISTGVQQSKRVLRKLHAQDRALERLEDKMGINRPAEPAADEGDDEA
jgi:hypothetical protein